MKKLVSALLTLALAASTLAANTASADSLVYNAEVLPGGTSAYGVTIVPDSPIPASLDGAFHVSVTTPASFKAPESTADATVYDVIYRPDGSIFLSTDTFSPKASVTVTYVVPGEGDTEEISAQWDSDETASISYDIVDDFITDVYTGSYQNADGETVELSIVYRLYVPENVEGQIPLVLTMHGSGESGNDGSAHVTASQIATCWADPAWQAEHPCYVFAPQWPESDVSNDLELRDSYLAVYHDMITEMQQKLNPSKTYLASLSMGSRLGFRFQTLYPNFFDAAIMCCGAMQNSDLSGITETPVWLVHAVADPVNAAQSSVDAYNQMIAAGNKDVHLTLITAEGMNGLFPHASWQQVFGNADMMNWLFSK